MASADFDEDGVPDVVSGWTGPEGSLLTLHSGNIDAIWPHTRKAREREAVGILTDEPFLLTARLFEIPAAPDYLGAGDFDNDGHRDVLAAPKDGTGLYLLSGDGRGGLAAARRVELPGAVTAMIVGEIDHADGLPDVIVGIRDSLGSSLLVFKGPEGALRSEPEVVALPDTATDFALGQLDDAFPFDLSVAAGNEVVVMRGRSVRPAIDSLDEQTTRIVDRFPMPWSIAAVAVGEFVWNGPGRQDLAVLSDDGVVSVLVRNPTESATDPIETTGTGTWATARKRRVLGGDAASDSATSTALLVARVSGLPTDDLVVLDPAVRELHVMVGEAWPEDLAADTDPKAEPGAPISIVVDGEPVAALAMRLDGNGLDDLVVLSEGATGPAVARSRIDSVITVNSIADTTTAGDAECTVREAIANANTNSDTTGGDCSSGAAGLDTIQFNIGGGGSVATITMSGAGLSIDAAEPVILDGTTQGCGSPPCIVLSNSSASEVLAVNAAGSTVRGLVLRDFTNVGIRLAATNITVEGNYIGTDAAGTMDASTGLVGIHAVGADNSTIGGTTSAARNVISGLGEQAILIEPSASAASGIAVQGNYVGTDATGTLAIPEVDGLGPNDGIVIRGAQNITIGGTVPGSGNLASGNLRAGIRVEGDPGGLFATQGNLVQGNLVGTDVNGTSAIPNQRGVMVLDAEGAGPATAPVTDNTIGGSAPGARNVCSGNTLTGVLIADLRDSGVGANLVEGNYIGTDITGAASLGNDGHGVFIQDSGNNVVGGVTAGERNIVSGNWVGISTIDLYSVLGQGVTGGSNLIQGNYVGTDVTGAASLGNGHHGVVVSQETGTIIGGSAPGAGNLVSGNTGVGIIVLAENRYANALRNKVQGNIVGTDVSGTAPLGNAEGGIGVGHATGTMIGGTASGEGNLIAYNGLGGVIVLEGFVTQGPPTVDNRVLGNSIFANAELGIDLGGDGTDPSNYGDGVTPNDPGDPDVGPNAFQNYPVLTAVDVLGPFTTVQGTLNSTADTTYRIEFYSTTTCDPMGYGEGQSFLGFTDVTTDAVGDASFSVSLPPVRNGHQVTATATTFAPEPECGNGFCEPLYGEDCLNCASDCAGVQGGNPGNRYCCAAGGGENPIPCGDPRCNSGGFLCISPVGTSEFSSCSLASCAALQAFAQTLQAPDKDTLSWSIVADVRFVKGPLTGVSTYATTAGGALSSATSLDISGDNPTPGTGLFYLVRDDGACDSWQTVLGTEPGRDASLP